MKKKRKTKADWEHEIIMARQTAFNDGQSEGYQRGLIDGKKAAGGTVIALAESASQQITKVLGMATVYRNYEELAQALQPITQLITEARAAWQNLHKSNQ